MITFPNAKINLGLHILNRRPDGFHDLETLFYPIPLCDILEIGSLSSRMPESVTAASSRLLVEGIPVEFTTTGIPIPGDPTENLILRALKGVIEASPVGSFPIDRFKENSPLYIHLHKAIPMGAGLGGGSSDATAMVLLLCNWLELPIDRDTLRTLVRHLGSDCTFFLENRPSVATGRGDLLQPVSLDLSEYEIRLAFPPVHVSTPEAYRMVTPRSPRPSLREIIRLPVEIWKETLVNDFEEPMMERFPEIRQAKDTLYQEGAVYASMTGSGSAVFGLFPRS